jgi:CRISPR-associated protein Cas1
VRTTDLQLLPRFTDGLTFLYVEHVRIEQDDHAIVLVDQSGRVPVPVASLAVLMVGPGVSLTHAAVLACADNGCSVVFCGESGVRLYASGLGETRRATNLMDQARAWADPREHMQVVQRMYRMRFDEILDEALTLQQVRGLEGVRVRETYARMSRETGIQWSGRSYRAGEWNAADPVNRALSTANACLYGLCHAAIVSTGFSPGLGFVHTGKSLAFVYDVADLYKCDVTIPLAFRAASGPLAGLETRARHACRRTFREARLLERIVPDIHQVLGLGSEVAHLVDTSDAPVDLWGPDGSAAGGLNYASLDDRDSTYDGGLPTEADDADADRAHVLGLEEDD